MLVDSSESPSTVQGERPVVVEMRVDQDRLDPVACQPCQPVLKQRRSDPQTFVTRIDGEPLDEPGRRTPPCDHVAHGLVVGGDSETNVMMGGRKTRLANTGCIHVPVGFE